jgi:hypothetical protein
MKPQRKKRLVMMAKAPREPAPLPGPAGVVDVEGREAAMKRKIR